jgi:hypothetical protein
MWDILELLGLEVQGLNSLLTETLARHPQMKDWRGQRKLLLVIARQKEESRPRMIPIGEKGTSIVFVSVRTIKRHHHHLVYITHCTVQFPHVELRQPPLSPMAT